MPGVVVVVVIAHDVGCHARDVGAMPSQNCVLKLVFMSLCFFGRSELRRKEGVTKASRGSHIIKISAGDNMGEIHYAPPPLFNPFSTRIKPINAGRARRERPIARVGV